MKGKDATLRRPPAFSFGSKNDAGSLLDPGPGPGAYDAPVTAASSKHSRGPAPAFGSGRTGSLSQNMPGPGQYSPTHIGPCHPAPAFHGASPVQQRSGVPGPGAYSPQRADRLLHPASPACTLAAKLEVPGSKDAVPGPGSYSPASGDAGKPGVTLKFRHAEAGAGGSSKEAALLLASTGPGAYGGAGSGERRQGPAFTMGRRLERRAAGDEVPGPGAYDHE